MNAKSSVTLEIMDKKFKVNCDSAEKSQIINASELVNRKIEEIKKHGKSIGSDRVAVMAALNIASEFVTQKENLSQHDIKKENKISSLLNKIESTLQALK